MSISPNFKSQSEEFSIKIKDLVINMSQVSFNKKIISSAPGPGSYNI